MNPNTEDFQWLRIADMNGEVPEFNRSRLVALGLAARDGNLLKITDKGKALLAVPSRNTSRAA